MSDNNKHNNNRKIQIPETPSISEQAALSMRKKFEHRTPSEAEREARIASMRTKGAKGCRLPRMNLALTEDNFHFVRSVGGAAGLTNSEFINAVLDEYKKNHPEAVELSAKLRQSMRDIFPDE